MQFEMELDDVFGERSYNKKTSDDIEANDSFDVISDVDSELSASHSLSPFDREQLASFSPIMSRTKKRSHTGMMEAPDRPIFSPMPVKRHRRATNEDRANQVASYHLAQRNLGPVFDTLIPVRKEAPPAPAQSPPVRMKPLSSSPPRQSANSSMSVEASPMDKTVPASPVSPLYGRMMTYMRHVQKLRFADVERFAAMHPHMFRDCAANYVWTCGILPILSPLMRAADSRIMQSNAFILASYVRIICLLRDVESQCHMIDGEHFGYMQVYPEGAAVINNNRRPADAGAAFNVFNAVHRNYPFDLDNAPHTPHTCDMVQQWCFLYDYMLVVATAGITWGSPSMREALLVNLAVLQMHTYGLTVQMQLSLC